MKTMTPQEIAIAVNEISWINIQVDDPCEGDKVYDREYGILGHLLKLDPESSIRLLLEVIEAQQLKVAYPEEDSPFKDMLEFKYLNSNIKNRGTFQQRVKPWLIACFGEAIASNVHERNFRFIEEALELVQSTGCTKEEVLELVDYVYSRPVGEPYQEMGGVMITLAALGLAAGLDMAQNGEIELERINQPEIIEKIRRKQASKPKHSSLPGQA